MAVYYYQGLPIIAPFTIESNEPMYVSETVSLRQYVSKRPTQRWHLSFKCQWSGSAGAWYSRLLDNYGAVETMTMPQDWSVVQRATINDTTVNQTTSGGHAPGADTILVNRNGQVGLLPSGTFFTFSNHTKVYMIHGFQNTQQALTARDINWTTQTSVPIKIYPRLQAQVPGGTILNFLSRATLRYRLSSENFPSLTFSDGLQHDVGPIKLIEAI